MSNPNSSQEQKLKLLKEAVKYQTNYRLEATIGKACDRHLFALMCASRDLGMDFPKIFMDKVEYCLIEILLLLELSPMTSMHMSST